MGPFVYTTITAKYFSLYTQKIELSESLIYSYFRAKPTKIEFFVTKFVFSFIFNMTANTPITLIQLYCVTRQIEIKLETYFVEKTQI